MLETLVTKIKTYVDNYAEPKKGTDDNYVTDEEKAAIASFDTTLGDIQTILESI